MTYFKNRVSRFVIIHVIILLFGAIQIYAASQCNQGLKLYSIESGEAVCAPLAPYQCIHSCEWNTSCLHTSHFNAFRGRRTFIAGMILTDSTFLIQCCASLSTIVEMTANREPVCVWTPEIETVNTRGSVRLDPPLDKNEYIRDAVIDRTNGQGKILVKLQICKFVIQRPHCVKENLPIEDRHLYSLLLLRLSRIQLLLNSTQNQNPVRETKVETPFHDDASQFSPRRTAAAFSVPVAVMPYYSFHDYREDSTHSVSSADPSSRVILRKGSGGPRDRTLPVKSLHSGGASQVATKRTIYTATKPIKSANLRPETAPRSKSSPARTFITHSTKEVLTNNWRLVQAQDTAAQPSETAPMKTRLHIKKLPRTNPTTISTRSYVPTTTPVTTTFRTTTLPTTVTILQTRNPYEEEENLRLLQTRNPYEEEENLRLQTRNPYEEAENLRLQQKQEALQGLLGCCQQVPGCRHLCSPSVTKQEIESALYSRSCPPLSMASMLKCFHQYYDTRSVRECCERPNQSVLSPIKLPQQCLNLCSPNFRISWEHFTCLNYVPTIYECYHDLIE
uniref:Domain of unknown function DB domain-containing protein n=2 Tax=Acrobeloides nanus TaxID=290746 RepID=A0A914C0H4_9BILA